MPNKYFLAPGMVHRCMFNGHDMHNAYGIFPVLDFGIQAHIMGLCLWSRTLKKAVLETYLLQLLYFLYYITT